MSKDPLKQLREAMARGEERALHVAEDALLVAAAHAEARVKALAPEDTAHLARSVTSDDKAKHTSSGGLRVEIGCKAVDENNEDYAFKVHEMMEYDGPNAGGSKTQARGPKTTKKGDSPIEPSDGNAGGKYMARATQNKPEVYAEIVANHCKDKL